MLANIQTDSNMGWKVRFRSAWKNCRLPYIIIGPSKISSIFIITLRSSFSYKSDLPDVRQPVSPASAMSQTYLELGVTAALTKISSPLIAHLNVRGNVLRALRDVDTNPGILLLKREIAQAEPERLDIIFCFCAIFADGR